MNPAFEAQLSENVFTGDFEDCFAQAAQLGRAGFEVFHFQPGRLRIAVVHPVKIGRENGGFASSGAGADFDNGIAVFVFVGWEQSDLKIALQVCEAFFQIGNFLARHLRHLSVLGRGQLAIIFQLPARALELVPERQHLLHAGMLAHDLARAFPIFKERRIGDLALEFGEALPLPFDQALEVHFRAPNEACRKENAGWGPPLKSSSAKIFWSRALPSCCRSGARIFPPDLRYRRIFARR